MRGPRAAARGAGPIVTNCSSSRMSEDLAARYGVPFFRSAVGEANVVDAMLAHDAVFGGEGNGGPIDPARRPGPRQLRRHGPAAGRDGRAANCRSANWPTSCRATRS